MICLTGMVSKGSTAALKSWKTRRINKAWIEAHRAEAASKAALKAYCAERGWHVAFLEGKTGAPRTGIIDAVAFRIAKGRDKADDLQVRLIQLKGGRAGVSGHEITRLKSAVRTAEVDWLIAALDEDTLHILPKEL